MILALDNVHAHYGKSHVLHGVSFNVNPGDCSRELLSVHQTESYSRSNAWLAGLGI